MRQLNSIQAIQLQYNNLLQSMQEGLIVLDSSGYVVAVHEAEEAGKLFGISNHSNLLGKHFSELY